MSGIFSRWRFRHLAFAWVGYWAALAVITLSDAVAAIWHVTNLPGGHGNISIAFDSAVIRLLVKQDAATIWTGRASIVEIALWVAVPPMMVWGIWLAGAARARIGGADAPAGVGAGSQIPDARAPGDRVASPERERQL